MIKYFSFIVVIMIFYNCFQKSNYKIAQTDSNCILVKDSADFGYGKVEYDSETLCLDTVFSYDYFEKENVKIKNIPFDNVNDTIKLNWSSNSYFIFKDSLILKNELNSKNFGLNNDYRIKSIYQINFDNKDYFAVFLFQAGVCNNNPEYHVILLNHDFQLIKFIKNENQFSTDPGCFCDINNDKSLDYINIDRNKEIVTFYNIEKWRQLKRNQIKIKYHSEELYVWTKTSK